MHVPGSVPPCRLHQRIRLGRLILASCTSGSGSATTSGSSSATGANSITYPRVVDLSHVISPSIPLWPGDPHVVFKVVATMNKDGYYLRSYTIGEHSATHMNAPNSFIAGNTEAITSYPAEQRVVPAVVIDVRDKVGQNEDYQLTKQDVLDWGGDARSDPVGLIRDPVHGVGRPLGGSEGVRQPGPPTVTSTSRDSPERRRPSSWRIGRSPAWASTRTAWILASTRPMPRTRRSRRPTRSRSSAWRT